MGLFSRNFAPSILRRLRDADAKACAAIHAAGFAYPWPVSEIEALIASDSIAAVAALNPATQALRGFSLARIAADEAEILAIAVATQCRRRGVGKALLRAQFMQLAAAGVRSVFLEVEQTNAAALALYRQLAFEPVGARPGYYRRAAQASGHALVMKKILA